MQAIKSHTARWTMPAAIMVLAVVGCSGSAPPPAAAKKTADAQWNAYHDQFIEAYFKAQPFFAVQAGRHEFDGMMPDWSAQGLSAEVARLREERSKAAAFSDDTLTAEHRFQRDYVLAQIDRDLYWLDKVKDPYRNPAWYINALDPDVYLSREYAPLEKREAAFIAYQKALPGIAANIRANLRTPMSKPLIEHGIAGFGGFAKFFKDDVPKVFASSTDPALAQELAAANAAAIKAMDELTDWLKAQRATATDDFAIGSELFAQMIEDTERVTTPVKEIQAAGRADLERNTAALKAACAQFLPNGTLEGCIKNVSSHKPRGGAVAAARAQLDGLRDFISKRGVVSIPGEEIAKVETAPPYNAQNIAYISIPGPYDKGLPSTYFIAPADRSWSKAEQLAYVPSNATLLFITVHEVWPGHFLQFLHANRVADPFGRLFVGYAFAEGWAHYAEELMWEYGYGDQSPELHIGQLIDALLRDVRLLSAIGLHTEGMTVQQSEQMFREQAYQDPGNARQQAARGTYDPAYLNYTMGKLMIRKLRLDWTESRGGRSAWKQFHDTFLSYGGPPIPLVRAAMLAGSNADTALF